MRWEGHRSVQTNLDGSSPTLKAPIYDDPELEAAVTANSVGQAAHPRQQQTSQVIGCQRPEGATIDQICCRHRLAGAHSAQHLRQNSGKAGPDDRVGQAAGRQAGLHRMIRKIEENCAGYDRTARYYGCLTIERTHALCSSQAKASRSKS